MLFSFFNLGKIIHVLFRKVIGHRHYSLPQPNQTLENHKDKIRVIDNKVSWSELDENLLGEIMSKLSPTCQARFHAVSRTWRSIHPIEASNHKSLPWLLSINRFVPTFSSTLECHLYEPASTPNCTTSLNKILLSKLGIPSCWANVNSSLKGGWFFISTRRTIFGFPSCRRYFFLFCPLTRNIIVLPKLDYWFRSTFDQTFSTSPDSPDCVFLILDTYVADRIVLMTCRHGDKEWTLRKFARVDNFVGCIFHTVYINKIFYIVSPCGQLASFNIMSEEFKFESLARDDDLGQMCNMQRRYRVFELNGELMIMYFGHSLRFIRRNMNTFPGIPCIKRFDWFAKVWIPVSSLGDQTLFVSDEIHSIMKVDEKEARHNGVLSNAIYYLCDLGCIVYSFENGVLVQFKYHAGLQNWSTINSLTNSVESGDLIDFYYNSGITYQDINKSFYWFEPPVVRGLAMSSFV